MAEETFRWPYEDLALKTRRCPGCEALPSAELIDKSFPPLYFCANELCAIRVWDPSKEFPTPSTRPHDW